MQRYFIKNNYRQNDIIIADDSMYKHMTKVMRMEKGEHVICIDEDGDFLPIYFSVDRESL